MPTPSCLESWTAIRMGMKLVCLCPASFVVKAVDLYLASLFRFFGIFWKCARIGERLSPYVSICCILMAVSRSKIPNSISYLLNVDSLLLVGSLLGNRLMDVSRSLSSSVVRLAT